MKKNRKLIMKEFTQDDISTALYDAFAYRLGPDVWDEAEQEFWEYLNASQQPHPVERREVMERPDIALIRESLPFISERIAKGTITHLIEYVEFLEAQEESDNEEGKTAH